jgi:alkylhydroperoxidase family enzyme
LARRLGATETELAALASGEMKVFDARVRAALEFAEKLPVDSNHVGNEAFTALRQHFSEAEIVELAAVAGLFNYFNRFNNALQMEPTR